MIIRGGRQIKNRKIGVNIFIPKKRTVTVDAGPYTGPDMIRQQLTSSNRTAYDLLSVGNFLSVSKSEYDLIAANVSGATKKGNSDAQISTRDSLTSWQTNWIAFGSGSTPSFQIDQGEYVIAYISEAWNQNGTSQLGYTTTFKGSSITNVGNAGSTVPGNRAYYIRKAPTDAATEIRYPTLYMSVSPNAVNNWNGFRSSDNGANWIALTNTQVAKIQILTTSTKTW